MSSPKSTLLKRVAIGLAIAAAFVIGLSLRGSGPAGDASPATTAEATVWTCSMHPQIQLPEPGACPICGMDLIPLMTSGDDDGPGATLTLSPSAQKIAAIQTTPVTRQPVTASLRMTGKLEVDETRVRQIPARVGGRIDHIYIDYTGISVRRGEKLFDLFSPELISAQEELIQAGRAVETLESSTHESARRSAVRTLDATRDRLRLWGLSTDQIAAIESRAAPTEHITITAPIGGVVLHKNAVEGTYVQMGTPVYTIGDLTNLWLELDAYESDLAWIREGQLVRFETQPYPGETFDGTVAFVDPVLNPKTRSVRVRVDVPNADGRLKPGLFAHATLSADVAGDPEGPLVIPASAPLITGRRAVVYVADQNEPGRFTGREVSLGARAGEYYVVLEGLEEGEWVVSNGSFKIDSALQIIAKPSMMSPSGGAPPPGHQHGEPPTIEGDYEKRSALTDVDTSFKRELDPLLRHYYDVSTALSLDDVATARTASASLAAAVETVKHGGLPSEGHAPWAAAGKTMIAAARDIAESDDIKAARLHFFTLSREMLATARQFGLSGDTPALVYHCPMAMDGNGADWLQDHAGTENPYYGSMMHKCGSETETLVASDPHEGHEHAGDAR